MRRRKPSGQAPPVRPRLISDKPPSGNVYFHPRHLANIWPPRPAHAAHLTVVQRTALGVLLRYREVEQELLVARVLAIGSKRRGRWRCKFTEDNVHKTLDELRDGCLVCDRAVEMSTTAGDPMARPIFVQSDPSQGVVGRVDYVKSAWVWKLTVEGWAVAKCMKLDRLYRR